MPENEYINANDSANPEIDTPSQVLTLNYVLSKIDALQNELTDLKNTVNNIGCVSDTDRVCEDSEDCSTVNAEVALAKIKALTEVFHHREESLQKLLALYEKMYEDLSMLNLKEPVFRALEKAADDEDKLAALSNLLDTIRQLG